MKNFIFAFAFAFLSLLLSAQTHGCIDLSNLHSENIQCTIGRYDNPFEFDSIVDHGVQSQYLRHSVVTQSSADPRTGYRLKTIPEGESYSIRLGNWNIGGEAESITCRLDVDTTDYDLLVLRYAAVMEDRYGVHSPEVRPRFTLEILDEDGVPINSGCTAADFVADSLLGWNAYDTIQHGHPSVNYWKDWTSVGVDLADYHGRTIKVRLVTYDCADGGCFGYAYFRLDCQKKELEASYCGAVDDIAVTAPDGFKYRWFFEHEPEITLSEERTAHVAMQENATLCCYVSFIENEDCGFTLKTMLTFRYPMAAFLWSETGCLGIVSFQNNSYVSNDGETPAPQWEPCQSAFWDFGDGYTSNEYHTEHEYDAVGDYLVTLVAKLNDGECTDTLRRNIHVSSAGLLTDTTDVISCVSYNWNGITYTTEGYHSQQLYSQNGCDSLAVINLSLGTAINYEFSVDTCGLYVWNDQVYESTGNYQQTFDIGEVCDSVVTLHLNMLEADEIFIDTTACEQFEWNDTVFRTSGLHQSTYVSDFGCEGVANINLTLEYAPRPTNIYSHVMGHYVIPSTEFQVNDFAFFLADSNACNVWDSVRWSVSRDDWEVRPCGVGCCYLYPYSYTSDTVWLNAKVYGGCSQQFVERRIWLLCTFYGVDECNDNIFVDVLPNPSKGLVTLRMIEMQMPISVSLFDMRGKAIRRFDVNQKEMVLDLSDLQKGLYMLVVEYGNQRMAKKIVLM